MTSRLEIESAIKQLPENDARNLANGYKNISMRDGIGNLKQTWHREN